MSQQDDLPRSLALEVLELEVLITEMEREQRSLAEHVGELWRFDFGLCPLAEDFDIFGPGPLQEASLHRMRMRHAWNRRSC